MIPSATRPVVSLVAATVLALGCGGDTTDPQPMPSIGFSAQVLDLGDEREALVTISNDGDAAVGPVELLATPVARAGVEIPGVSIAAEPDEIPTLNPGDSVVVRVRVTGADELQAGRYASRLTALVHGSAHASTDLTFDVPLPLAEVASVEILDPETTFRQGDVVTLSAIVRDTLGVIVPHVDVTWSVIPGAAAFINGVGDYVPYQPGEVRVVARVGDKADTLSTDVAARAIVGGFGVTGSTDEQVRYTSDIWIHGDVAYTGSWGTRVQPGNAVYVWDISNDTPVRTDSVIVNAYTVNDVKISADGTFAVLTHEYMASPNAITILDMTDPRHPVVAGGLLSDEPGSWVGVHNVWIDGDYVYIVVDGSAPNRGLWIIDVSDRAHPVRVARYYAGSSFLHDVYVRDGLAFLSHWDAGLVILDVGNGIRGGSPSNPVEVSRIPTSGGQTHNAWYWPEAGYVFVGEEDFGSPGHMHVVDVADLQHPIEVATFRVAGDTPHNFWLDEDRGILYMAWYSRGLQALDVSGRLMGRLDLQGRFIAALQYDGVQSCPGGGAGTCTWAPQLHDGFVYVSDMNTGIWKLKPNF